MVQSVRKQWVLDVQWSDAPQDVIEEVRQYWIDDDRMYNDVCIWKFEEEWSWNQNHPEWKEGETVFETEYPAIERWLSANDVPHGSLVWIHWWW